MLGYFKPDFGVLSKEQKGRMKCLHCSVCKSIQKNYGMFATLFLNYDFEFIYMTYAPDIKLLKTKKTNCVLNPLKQVEVYDTDFTKISDLTIFAVYIYFLDKKIDSEFNFVHRVLSKILRKNFLKIETKFFEEIEKIRKVLNTGQELELVSEIYKDVISDYLDIAHLVDKKIYSHMIEIMYYFDYFEDYFEDKKKNRKTPISHLKESEVVMFVREKIMREIFLLKLSLSTLDNENRKMVDTILEYSLQSKFNHIKQIFQEKLGGI